MAQTTYQVILSTGKHTVLGTIGDPTKAKEEVFGWVKAYDRVVEVYALMLVCAVHQVPLVRVQGKKGPFWSCHQRNPDGSFCSYKPSRR